MAPPPPPPRGRRRLRKLVRATSVVALLVLASTLFFGCTAVITPPRELDDPCEVFLLLDGQHRGLILPSADDALVEYAYGEWWWYALEDDAWYDAFRAVLWPTQGAVGKRRAGASDLEGLRRRYHWMRIEPITVERRKAGELAARLDAVHGERRDEAVYSERYRFEFVPHEASYWAFHNCNDVVADWLAELGCDVSWVPLCLGLHLDREVD